MNRHMLFLLLALLLAGCATPERRISRNPEAFAALTPAQQEIVREGKVTLGLPEAGVRLALGGPSRVFTRYTEEGAARVWSYGFTDSTRSRNWVRVTARDGSRHWVDVDEYTHREVETLRLEFRDGRVVAIERLNR